MKRLTFTLLVAFAGFAAIASFGNPDARSDKISLERAEVMPSCRATG